MIKLFNSTDKTFNGNGDKIINPTKAKVVKKDNGDYYLDFECGLQYQDDIKPNAILVANTPTGYQAFRIETVNINQNKIQSKVRHVFYDGEKYAIFAAYSDNKTVGYMLDHANSSTDNTSPFTVSTDITTVGTYHIIRKNLVQVIQELINRYGGHLVRDNYKIAIKNEIGVDNGITIKYAKNLKSITASYDWSGVVTKLMPVGYDGLTLPERYLTSNVEYDIPYTRIVSFTQSVNQDDYTDSNGNVDETAYKAALTAELRQLGQDYVAENCYPVTSYTIKANVEKVTDIGDIIAVEDERLGVNLLTRVIGFTYDCILEKYTEITFGNFAKSIRGLSDTIQKQTSKKIVEETAPIRTALSNEVKQATNNILGMMGNSYVIYDGNQIMVVDRLPKENATNVLRINAGGIGFSNTGINGTFNSAWQIDGTLDMQQINVINLVADMIKGGTLKLGSNLNESGLMEVYDNSNNKIAIIDNNGIRVNAVDGSYVVLNGSLGFRGYDKNGNNIYWASADEFHMTKASIENEITFLHKIRFISISTDTNDGVGVVPTYD